MGYTSTQMKFAGLELLIAGCGLLAMGRPANAQSWTLTSAATNVNWSAIACSADGSKLVALNSGTGIWFSSNGGTTWSAAIAPAKIWSSVAASADGTRVAAVDVSDGAVYTSSNSGFQWLAGSILNSQLNSVACSADGTRLVAAAAGGSVYTSTDSGLHWTPHQLGYTFTAWAASSADGTRLVVAANLGDIFTSSDSGATWSAGVSVGGPLYCVASSADGSRLAAGGNATVYLSKDFGATWTVETVPGASHMNFNCIAASADGTRLVAAAGSTVVSSYGQGNILVSTDAGSSWTAAAAPYLYWSGLASSADGNRLAGAASWNLRPLSLGTPGGIYTNRTVPAPGLNLTTSGGRLQLSWLVPSMTFKLQQNGELTPSGWMDLTATPVLNLTNLQYELPISPVNSQGFYRFQLQ